MGQTVLIGKSIALAINGFHLFSHLPNGRVSFDDAGCVRLSLDCLSCCGGLISFACDCVIALVMNM